MDLNIASIAGPPSRTRPVLGPTNIKLAPEDFVVEEIPAYEPTGDGEHLFLLVQKRDVAAAEMIARLGQMLKVKTRDIGVAGQKDRHAITRQFVSVPASCRDQLQSCCDGSIRILTAMKHTNKLRTGHLAGNRFRIALNSPQMSTFAEKDAIDVRQRLLKLSECGFPNYFGPQRFGHDGNSVREGIALLRKDLPSPRWGRSRQRFMKKMTASAVQSAVFNLVVASRVNQPAGLHPRSGDVVCHRDGLRPFSFDQRGSTSARDLIPMGPMPGPKMMEATSAVQQLEQSALEQLSLAIDNFARSPKLTPGTRRRMLEFPRNTSARLEPNGSITVQFELPPGAFATVLLAEICSEVIDGRGRGRAMNEDNHPSLGVTSTTT